LIIQPGLLSLDCSDEDKPIPLIFLTLSQWHAPHPAHTSKLISTVSHFFLAADLVGINSLPQQHLRVGCAVHGLDTAQKNEKEKRPSITNQRAREQVLRISDYHFTLPMKGVNVSCTTWLLSLIGKCPPHHLSHQLHPPALIIQPGLLSLDCSDEDKPIPLIFLTLSQWHAPHPAHMIKHKPHLTNLISFQLGQSAVQQWEGD
jgi:hypothetical protein